MYFRRKTSAGRAYLQIVESRRDGTSWQLFGAVIWGGGN
jgi:hypothetical protein